MPTFHVCAKAASSLARLPRAAEVCILSCHGRAGCRSCINAVVSRSTGGRQGDRYRLDYLPKLAKSPCWQFPPTGPHVRADARMPAVRSRSEYPIACYAVIRKAPRGVLRRPPHRSERSTEGHSPPVDCDGWCPSAHPVSGALLKLLLHSRARHHAFRANLARAP